MLNVDDYPDLALCVGNQYGVATSFKVTTTNGSANITFVFDGPRFAPYTNPVVGDVFSLRNPEDFGLTVPEGMNGLPVVIISDSNNTAGAAPGPYQIALTFGGSALVATASNTGVSVGYNLGCSTFVLPDLRGRSIFGRDNMGGTDANRLQSATSDGDVLGVEGGAETHTLTAAEIPAHTHTYDDSTPTSANTRGTGASATMTGSTLTGRTTAANIGGGGAHNNMPPFFVLNWIIRALP
jgi:microcystin-dependent protein